MHNTDKPPKHAQAKALPKKLQKTVHTQCLMPFTQSSKTLLGSWNDETLRVAEGAVRVEGALYSHESCSFLCGWFILVWTEMKFLSL